MDYSSVTETAQNRVTQEALRMMYTRYEFARIRGEGRRVLEIACGAGQGLGYIAKSASQVIGGDLTHSLLSQARSHYEQRVPLVQMDAHKIPFSEMSFDVVALFEAIYYLENPQQFAEECFRILTPGGVLLISSANKEQSDFNPSPYSKKYYSANELRALLSRAGFLAEIFGSYVSHRNSVRSRMISFAKRSAVALNLIPKTMRGKEWLKRIFLGSLVAVPKELEYGINSFELPQKLKDFHEAPRYKVIFAVGRKLAQK